LKKHLLKNQKKIKNIFMSYFFTIIISALIGFIVYPVVLRYGKGSFVEFLRSLSNKTL